MPVVTVYDHLKKKVGDLNLDDRVFNVPYKSHLIYEVVRYQQAKKRSGTASTKSRGQVRGGGAKPFNQKGTGRARQGSIRSAIQVGGGVAFGPKPRSYAFSLPKKVLKGALRVALSQQCKEKKITVLKELKLEKAKTKEVATILKKFSLEKGLIVSDNSNNVERSVANLRHFKYVKPEGLNVYDILKFQNLFVTESALLKIEKRLQP
jgi:large subunit ribosomal protein L4